MKKCKTCNIEKEYSEFRVSKRHKDGHINECKLCMKVKDKKYKEENKEHIKKSNKAYYELNKKEIMANINKDSKRESDKKYLRNNLDKIKLRHKTYYEKNKEKIIAKAKEYYKENKNEINKPTDRKRELKRERYKRKKYQYSWREILRKTVTQLKFNKNQTTLELLKYSYDDLKIDIESKFTEGMTWDNHGEWHIDHIIPIAKFKEGTHPSIVNCLENLRPIWAKENLMKQDNIDYSYMDLINKLEPFLIIQMLPSEV